MSASPLAAALLGGDNNAAAFLGLDPAAMQALPDIQLGQSLEQSGLSTAPAYLPQALARVIQAGTGEFVKHQAYSDLAKAMSGSLEGLQQIFPAGTPIGDGLRSPIAMVRMMSAQQAPKAMLLNSERFGLEAGQESHALGSPNATAVSGQPQSAPGKIAADAERAAGAGQPAASTALTRALSKEGMTPEGVPYPAVPINPPAVIPRSIRTGAALTAAIPPPEAMAAAKQKLAQNLTAAQNAGVTNPTATGMSDEIAAAQAKIEAAKEAAKTDVSTGKANAIATAKGTEAASEKLYGGASEALGKAIGEQIEAGGKNARDRMNALNTIDDALNAGGKGVITGPLAERALKAKEALDAWGIDTSWVKAGLPESEVVSKMNAQLASASAKAMTGRPTQFEFSAWMKNNPGLLTSKAGTQALTNILKQTTQQDIDIGRLAQNKGNWEHWADTVDDYYKKHPLISPFTNKAMAQEVAAPTRPMTATNKQTGSRMQSLDGGATWLPLQAQ